MFRGIALAICVLCYSTVSAKVIISEFRTRGPLGGNDEFIEIYNTGPDAVDVGSYKIMGSNSSGTTSLRAVIPPGTVMPPYTYYLLVNGATNGYSGTVPGDLTYTVGIADNGGIALVDPDGDILDQVGMSVGSAYKEGTPLVPFSSTNKDQSYSRKTVSCGPDQDTEDNAHDFQYNDGFSNPQNSKSCRPECAGDPCISPPNPYCYEQGECVSDTCVYTPKPEGTPCDDSNPCTVEDVCDAQHECVSTPKDCTPPPDECVGDTSRHYTSGACDQNTGECVYEFEDTDCELGCDPATGQCIIDPCAGVVCDNPPNLECYEAQGVCVDGECQYIMFAEGTLCDDGDLCTISDQCDAQGDCKGQPVECPLPGPECVDDSKSRLFISSACDPVTGDCVYEFEDHDCEFGCDIATGLCQNDPCAGVICDNPPGQCYEERGSCSQGICYYDPKPAGTPCNDDDPCTFEDACDGVGECKGEPIVCNTPPNLQCYLAVGTCIEGACEYEALDPETPCDDGDLCTVSDSCDEFHNCVGRPKVCEVGAPACIDVATSRVVQSSYCDATSGECVSFYEDYECTIDCDQDRGFCNNHPVISQFRTRGPLGGYDEFIEIFNPSSVSVDLSGYQVLGSSDSGYVQPRFTVPDGTILGPRQFFLAVNSNSTSVIKDAADLTYGTGISDMGGIALQAPDGTIVDAIGLSTGSAFFEGTPLEPVTQNIEYAYERLTLWCGPDKDTDNNAQDFVQIAEAHPRNSKSCAPECFVPRCPLPEDYCKDTATLVDFTEASCLDEECVITFQEVACEFGCDPVAKTCRTNPCENVVCNTPPNLECYEEEGECMPGDSGSYTCAYSKKAQGTPCNDNNPCTVDDQCLSTGECIGALIACDLLPPECIDENTSRVYVEGACDPATGECVYQTQDAHCDFGCDDKTGLCFGDPCEGVFCTDPPGICYQEQGVCQNGNCIYSLKPAGSSCDDLDPCTEADNCDEQGKCAGTPIVCDTPPTQCYEAQGICVDGACVYNQLPAGTPCDDNDPCTVSDSCDDNGMCVGQPDPSCLPADDLGIADDAAPGMDESGVGYDAMEVQADVMEAEIPPITVDVFPEQPQVSGGGGGGCSAMSASNSGGIAFIWVFALVFMLLFTHRQVTRKL